MTNPKVVLGIDGGGTKTAAVVIDESGQVRGRAQAGSTNWNSVGREKARENLQRVIESALIEAGRSAVHVGAVCIGAAGVDRPGDRKRMTEWLQEIVPGAAVAVYNDAVAALASGTEGEIYGLVIISGTGMIVYGFDREGNSARAGGWGALIGDPGGGYALARDGLEAIARAADGRGPETTLTQTILEHLELTRPEDLIGWAYADYTWQRFAALAPLVIQCAEDGDPVADRILDQGARALADGARAVVARLGLREEAFPLVLSGGTLRPGPYAERVAAELQRHLPDAQIIQPKMEPAAGAALLARKLSETG